MIRSTNAPYRMMMSSVQANDEEKEVFVVLLAYPNHCIFSMGTIIEWPIHLQSEC